VTRVASAQHGVIGRAQALAAGLSPSAIKRRVKAARWIRLLPRVYRVGGASATGRQGMMAATLWAGDGGLLSYRAGGVLWGLDAVTGDVLEVTAPKRLSSDVVIAHRAPAFPPIDRDAFDAIPVTSPTRTLIDLATVLGPDSLELALEDALRRGLTSRRPWPGALRERSGGQASMGLTRAGLPRPVPQYEIRNRGRLIARVDLAYPDLRIAIEFDSDRWRSGRRRREADMERRNSLTAAGRHVVHVSRSELSAGARRPSRRSGPWFSLDLATDKRC
jgi:hypothetical protein